MRYWMILLLWSGFGFSHTSPIDSVLENRLGQGKQKIAWPICDDVTFLRRVYVDITGGLPDWEVAERWDNRPHPWDRQAIVNEALAHEGKTHRWTYFIEELLGIYAVYGEWEPRERFHIELKTMVAANMPWDALVREFFQWQGGTDKPGSLFSIWGVAQNDPLTWLDAMDEKAAFVSKAFLGLETRCISCHDGAAHLEDVNVGLSHMTREEFWGLAAFFSSFAPHCGTRCVVEGNVNLGNFGWYDFDDPTLRKDPRYIRLHAEDSVTVGYYTAQSDTGEGMRPSRNGGQVTPRYPFTGETPRSGELHRAALGRILTADRQFARNMVNRVWKHFYGQGFVEPVDSFDLARIDPVTAAGAGTTVQGADWEMLEMLTDLFIDADYDLHELMRLITSSSLYQLDYDRLPDSALANGEPYYGGINRYRRLESEAIVESVVRLTGVRNPIFVPFRDATHSVWDFSDTDQPAFEPELRRLLDDLGRGNRLKKQLASEVLDHSAALALMNNEHLLQTYLANGPVLQSLDLGPDDNPTVVRKIYRHWLGREPDAGELAAGTAQIETHGTQGIRDLFWAMMNHPNFLYR